MGDDTVQSLSDRSFVLRRILKFSLRFLIANSMGNIQREREKIIICLLLLLLSLTHFI